MNYEPETLDEDYDDGTMPSNVEGLASAVVGHKIAWAGLLTVPDQWYGDRQALVIILDDGRRVELHNTDDCCAYTDLEAFLLNVQNINHVITGVGTTDGYTKWHIYADLGDVLELTVGWSCGNPFYYGYGFDIRVKELTTTES